MPKNAANDAAKKKAAKEKKMLVVLALVLVVALGYAYRTLTKLHSSPTSTPVPATTTSASSTGSPTTPPSSTSTPAASPSGSTTAPAGAAASGSSGGLVSAVTPPLGQGQLRTFTLFDSKDPFFAQGPTPSGPGSGSSGSGSTGIGGPSSSASSQPAKSKPPASSSPSGSSSTPTATAPTSAVISVNGTEGVVATGGVFPTASSDPSTNGLFRLVSLTKTTAKIAIVGGSYASGAATLTLQVGQPVTLANTADGTRYTLRLYPQGTVPPAPSSSSGTSLANTTTPTS